MNTTLLEIRLFGSFDASLDGQPLPPLRSRAEKWLLMLLALRPGHAVSREWLAATLWPDSETALGLYNLRRCLTNLRKALGAQASLLLSPSPQTVCLDPTHMRVDVAAFDAAIAVGSIESLEEAAALYRGPLLEDCSEEWALTARTEREQAYLAALETLAAHAACLNQPTAAVRYLRLTIAAEPLREAAHGALMQALADCGDYAAVTQIYRDLRVLLLRELNAEPSAETIALYRHLQQQARQAVLPPPLPSSMPRRRLPVPLTPLVGRENNIAEVVDWLRKERLVTLLGPGGVGKTRLSIAAAEVLAPEYADGVWFVELASLTDPALVTRTVAATLGVKEEAGHTFIETLAAAVASRSLLLILDNCEHLLDACAALADALLSRCSSLRVLATSREALGLVGEHHYHTPSLALPPITSRGRPPGFDAEDVAWLMEYGGVRLFVERAMQVRPSFRLTGGNADSVLGTVQDLDGIPLAIELAAARMRTLSIAEIRSRLHDRFRLLTGGSRTALPRQQTLRALIDWSYDLLTEREKSLLLRLSVFAGGWSLEAAEFVCAEPGKTDPTIVPRSASLFPHEVLDLLTALIDKSLVVHEEQQGETRSRLLETIRQYARDRLAESGEAVTYRARHRDFFLALAEEAEEKLIGPDQGQWLNRLETEHDNLRQALTSCLDEGESGEIGLRLGAALLRFWQIRGHLSEGREYLTALLGSSEARGHTKARARALLVAGRLSRLQSDYASASSLLEEALEIFREFGDRKGIANSLLDVGNVAWSLGDYASARSLQEETLETFREFGDRHGIGNSLVIEALIAYRQGDYASVHSLFEQSLEIFRELGDRNGIAVCLTNLGLVTWKQGDYASARSLYEEGLEIRRELVDRQGIAHCLGNIALVAYDQGDYASARSLQEESLEIRRELGDRHGIALSLGNLALVAHFQSDYPFARTLQEESLAIRRELGDRHGVATSLNNLGNLACDQQNYAAARSLYEESLEIRRELGDRHGIAMSLTNLGLVACKQGDYACARSAYEESLEKFGELGDRHTTAIALESFASLNAAEGKHKKAARLWGAAERLREELDSPMSRGDRDERDRDVTKVRAGLDEKDFAAAWAEGRAMTMEQAIQHALANSG